MVDSSITENGVLKRDETASKPVEDAGAHFSPENYPQPRLEKLPEIVSTTYNPYPQSEPALKMVVDAQINALWQHTDDSRRILESELDKQIAQVDGKIELIRRDINDLQGERHQKHQHGWDKKMVFYSVLGGGVVAGAIELARWLIDR